VSRPTKSWLHCLILTATLAVGISAALADTHEQPSAKLLSGGDATVFVTNQHAFAKSSPNLSVARLRDFAFGNRLFNTNWVVAPASVKSLDGLGPVFNRVSCSGCHTRDGRGQPPAGPSDGLDSMLIRISLPGKNAHGGPKPHPAYGNQLNERAIPGVPAEATTRVTWHPVTGIFGDGSGFELRRPKYEFINLNFGPLGGDIMVSPRVAPAMFGLGLLEAVPKEALQAMADPEDADGDGISGRINMVWDDIHQRMTVGLYGWKANQPSLRQQAAAAANGDMGITTSLYPKQNVGQGQTKAAAAYADTTPELSDAFLDKLTFYTQTLAPPARRDVDDPQVIRGEQLFADMGCASCHTPTLQTGEYPDVPELGNQTIHPYTDMLLHDMGDDLADGRPDFDATGNEWRTAPLWGLGLIEVVNRHTFLLHDGRARNVTEAILWHGGEAEASRERFRHLSAADRAAVVKFLNSL